MQCASSRPINPVFGDQPFAVKLAVEVAAGNTRVSRRDTGVWVTYTIGGDPARHVTGCARMTGRGIWVAQQSLEINYQVHR